MNILTDWPSFLPGLLAGLGVSVQVALLSLLIGIPGGLLLAIGAGSKKKLVRTLIIGIVEIGRGTPALVVLQIFYFGSARNPAAGVALIPWASLSNSDIFTDRSRVAICCETAEPVYPSRRAASANEPVLRTTISVLRCRGLSIRSANPMVVPGAK